jgi:hypothetical protein
MAEQLDIPASAFVRYAYRTGGPIEPHTYAGAYHDFDYPGIKLHEEPGYRTTSGVVPIGRTDPAAREDALALVPAFLGRYLLD